MSVFGKTLFSVLAVAATLSALSSLPAQAFGCGAQTGDIDYCQALCKWEVWIPLAYPLCM